MTAEQLLQEIKHVVEGETSFADSISEIDFEGPKVVLYCKSLEPLMGDGEVVKELARKIRKRVVLRPDPSILTEREEAEKNIRLIIPPEAGVTNMHFSPDVGEVTIEAQKPGIAIGKGGSVLREIMQKVSWTPRVVRVPRSNLISWKISASR